MESFDDDTVPRAGALAERVGRVAELARLGLRCPSCLDTVAQDVRVGTDVQSVDAVAEAVQNLGRRYLDYVFTPREVADCGWPTAADRTIASGLAARYAAKEAAIKVLRPTGPRVPWRDLEIVRADAGWCSLELSGRAAVLGEAEGLHSWALSLTHDGAYAVATVLAIRTHGNDASSDRAT